MDDKPEAVPVEGPAETARDSWMRLENPLATTDQSAADPFALFAVDDTRVGEALGSIVSIYPTPDD